MLARGENPAERVKLDRIAATVAASGSFKEVADEWLLKVEKEGRSAITMKKLRVTRNVAAFRAGRVKLHNPRSYTPADEEEDGDWGQAGRSGPLWLKNLFVR